jgi:hypothetical protein
MRADQTDRRQRRVTALHRLEHAWHSAHQACRRYPAVGGMFGEVKDLGAIPEKGRATLGEVQPPGIDLCEDLDQVTRYGALRRDGTPQLDQQFVIREASERFVCSRHIPL